MIRTRRTTALLIRRLRIQRRTGATAYSRTVAQSQPRRLPPEPARPGPTVRPGLFKARRRSIQTDTRTILSAFKMTTKTKQIYQYDETLREHPTKIAHIHPISSLDPAEQPLYKPLLSEDDSNPLYALETASTIFYVQGGGQPPDTGEFLSPTGEPSQTFQVLSVRYGLNNRILHFGRFRSSPSPPNGIPFSPGDTILQKVNSAQRDLHSRIHTAGHIVSLAIRQLSQEKKDELNVKELKAQHYPSVSFVEFTGLIDGKFKEDIQVRANELVKKELPIEVSFCSVEELAEKGVIVVEGMPIVTGEGEKVRVVDIVGLGAYPCGGTHTAHTGQVKGIVVRTVKRQKGATKVSYAVVD